MRRLIAIGLVLSLTGSAAESVLGELRDGTVHHESVAKAAIHHAEFVGAEHGHEQNTFHWPRLNFLSPIDSYP